MKIDERYLTKNNCYIKAAKMTPKGMVIHSVGVGQPNKDVFVKSWNVPKPNGYSVCVHAFIDDNGVAQTLPWNYKSWGCGRGSKGSYNDNYIQVELCEPAGIKYNGGQLVNYDAKKNQAFFNKVYQNAVNLAAKLVIDHKLDINNIVSHTEAHKLGYASNHSDVGHWFPKHGKTMDNFRQDVRNKVAELSKTPTNPPLNQPTKPDKPSKPSKPSKPDVKLWRVQCGAFKHRTNANNLSVKLKANGYNTYLVEASGLFKVQVGAFANKVNATKLQSELKAKGFDTYIV